MLHDVVREAHDLIQRGLDHFAQGQLREAAQAWERATRLQPQDRRAARLLAFVRRKVNDADGRPPATRHETLESPIPGYLAGLTVESEVVDQSLDAVPVDEWAKVETRRVLASMDDLKDCELKDPDAGDTWKELPVRNGTLQSGTYGLVDECKTALASGRADSAALAAEMAIQMGEQAYAPGVYELLNPARPIFEQAFTSYLGDMNAAPIRAMPAEALVSYGFDHRAAFLMSRMDGGLSVSDLLHVAGMSGFEALRLLAALKRAQAIDMVPDSV